MQGAAAGYRWLSLLTGVIRRVPRELCLVDRIKGWGNVAHRKIVDVEIHMLPSPRVAQVSTRAHLSLAHAAQSAGAEVQTNITLRYLGERTSEYKKMQRETQQTYLPITSHAGVMPYAGQL